MKRYQQAQAREDFDSHEVGLIQEALGNWDVKYPGPDGMIREDYIERLKFMRDGTYLWKPSPVWAPETGEWRVMKTKDGRLKLGFKDLHRRWRWGYLVLMRVRKDGAYFMNWTRTRGDAVIFKDRIFRADRSRKD